MSTAALRNLSHSDTQSVLKSPRDRRFNPHTQHEIETLRPVHIRPLLHVLRPRGRNTWRKYVAEPRYFLTFAGRSLPCDWRQVFMPRTTFWFIWSYRSAAGVVPPRGGSTKIPGYRLRPGDQIPKNSSHLCNAAALKSPKEWKSDRKTRTVPSIPFFIVLRPRGRS